MKKSLLVLHRKLEEEEGEMIAEGILREMEENEGRSKKKERVNEMVEGGLVEKFFNRISKPCLS
jgi:hypothetical protein